MNPGQAVFRRCLRITRQEKQLGIKLDIKVISHIEHVNAFHLPVMVGVHQVIHLHGYQGQADAGFPQGLYQALFHRLRHFIAFRISAGQVQRQQFTLDDFTAHVILSLAEPFPLLIHCPAIRVQQAGCFSNIRLVVFHTVQGKGFPLPDPFVIFRLFLRRGIFRQAFRICFRSPDHAVHPLADTDHSVHGNAVQVGIFIPHGILVHTVGNGLPDVLCLHFRAVRRKNDEGQADPGIVGHRIAFSGGNQIHSLIDRIPANHFVQQLELILFQFFDHVLVPGEGKAQLRNRGFEAFRVSLEIRVDLKRTRTGFAVPGSDRIRAAAHRGMGQVAAVRIHHRGLEQFPGKNPFSHFPVLIADIDALPVIINPAARGDLMDRIRQEPKPVQFKEIRKSLRLHPEFDHPVIRHPDTGKVRHLAGDIFLIAFQVGQVHRPAAQLGDLRCDLEQDGEGIVPGRDLCSVGIIQVIHQLEPVDPGFLLILKHPLGSTDYRVGPEKSGIITPGNQVIGVDQRSHVNVGCGVAPHTGKEFPVHPGGVAHCQLLIIPVRISRHGRLRGRGNAAEQQHSGSKQCDQSFHES